MPSREEETVERQAQWDGEFASGSTIVAGYFALVNPLFNFLKKCNYTTTTMGITEDLIENKFYLFISHRPDVLKAMMGDVTATRLWTNSLVIMSPNHFHRGLFNNISGLFVDFEKNIGGFSLLDDAQVSEWKKAVKSGWKKEPLPFEEELKLMKHLSHAQATALSKLVERLEGSRFDYSDINWTPRESTELKKVEVGKHGLERDRMIAILSGATAAVTEPDLRTDLSKLLKKIPTTDEDWIKISHGIKHLAVQKEVGGEDVVMHDDKGVGGSKPAKKDKQKKEKKEVEVMFEEDEEGDGFSENSFPDSPMDLDDSDDEEDISPPPRKPAKKKESTSSKDKKGKGQATKPPQRSSSPSSPPKKRKRLMRGGKPIQRLSTSDQE